MKNIRKKSYFAGLLSFLLIFGFINVVNGVGKSIIINTNPTTAGLHTISIHSLFLGNNSGYSSLKVPTGGLNLEISSGLIVGYNNSVNTADGVIIGGGSGNIVEGNGAGIGGGQGNKVTGLYGFIGGGKGNKVEGNGGGIGGGQGNEVTGPGSYGVVVGGSGNKVEANNSIILGGFKNNAQGENSLVLGSGSHGSDNSFVWNTSSSGDDARIAAKIGVLIGTYQPITGVKLVISGAIKLGSGGTQTGEINIDGSGCIKTFDGTNSYVLGRASEIACRAYSGCQFGKTILHHGDIVTGYKVPYAENCTGSANAKKLTCDNGVLKNGSTIINDYYPYCYKVHTDPRKYPSSS